MGAALQHLLPTLPAADIPSIVTGIHQAFSLGVASTFIIGVGASVLAALAAAAMQELKLRRSLAPQTAPAAGQETGRPIAAAD
jgi:hypothetical protein